MSRCAVFLFLMLSLPMSRLGAQDIEDPSARKPYRAVVQTGLALEWFDEQFKCFAISVERPLNLYNHVGAQANFFFPNGSQYNYRAIKGNTYEIGIFAKCFFHGRLTGRRSNAYFGPDMRWGQRFYQSVGAFGEPTIFEASIFKFMARIGWQYHFGPAVLEFALPFGYEKENIKGDPVGSGGFPYYYYTNDNARFVAAPIMSLGIGF